MGAEWMTFSALRQDSTRTWLRLSDLIAAVAELGGSISVYETKLAIRESGVPRPTVKRYGHYHYGPEHLEAVVAYAKRERLV